MAARKLSLPPLTTMRRSVFISRGNIGSLQYSRLSADDESNDPVSAAGRPLGLLLALLKAS